MLPGRHDGGGNFQHVLWRRHAGEQRVCEERGSVASAGWQYAGAAGDDGGGLGDGGGGGDGGNGNHCNVWLWSWKAGFQ